MRCDRSPKSVVTGAEDLRRIIPVFRWIQPNGTVDELRRLPRVSGPDVAVQKWIGVTQYLQVHSEKVLVAVRAHCFNCFSQNCHALQELRSLTPFQIGQLLGPRIVRQQDAVSREPLHITHDCEPSRDLLHHGRILPADRRADPVLLPGFVTQCVISLGETPTAPIRQVGFDGIERVGFMGSDCASCGTDMTGNGIYLDSRQT